MAADFTTSKVNSAETSNASKFNAFVQAVQDGLNAIGDTSKMAFTSGAWLDLSMIKQGGAAASDVMTWNGAVWAPAAPSGGGGGTTIPAGVIEMYGGTAAPAGWLLCDGTAVSRVTYAALFTAIGTAYGNGDGATTFNVPDLRGRMPVGYAASGGHANVSTLGNNDGSALANRRPKHQHDVYDPGHTHSYNGVDVNKATAGVDRDANIVGGTTGSQTTGVKVNPGGLSSSSDPNNAPAYVVVNFIVKSS